MGGEAAGGGEPFKGSTGCTRQNLYYNLYLLVLGSFVARLNVNRQKVIDDNKGRLFCKCCCKL